MITRIRAIAWNTFTELVRMKVFYFLLIFALALIASSLLMARLSFAEEFQMLKDTSLGTMSIFSSLLAILATANFLPKDLEDRTIYTILAKPVPRFSYLLGKLGGILLMLLLAILIMTGLFLLVLWMRENAVLVETRSQITNPEALEQAVRGIRESTFNSNLLPGITIIFMKAALLASLTLFISTFATSGLFTIIIAMAIYFIGHMQATAREFWLGGMDVQWWTKLLVALVALLFPDLQAFNLVDDVVGGVTVPLGLFLQTFALGWVYVTVYFALAAFIFAGREL